VKLPRPRSIVAIAAVVSACVVAGGCGDADDAAGGTATLRWFIFNEPSGAPQAVAKRCSQQSGGRYRIEFKYLPSSADQQREQLVRRLAADDDTIDLIGMDIVWTGEFANAGWLEPVPESRVAQLTDDVFESVLDTAEFDGRLYNVPIWSNTQLLWYRSDRVHEAPQTWSEMLRQAARIGAKGGIEVQASRYEGLVVWANAMIESAGTSILSGPGEIELDQDATELALATMGRVARSPAAAAGIDTSTEDSARLAFESGRSSFMVNYPFVHPSAQANAPRVFENMAAAKYPKVRRDLESKPPLGGINIGVSAFSDHKQLAFDAIECLVRPENQLEIARRAGLPPVREDLYDRPEIDEIYPGFADIIHESIQDAAPRPSESPAYQDVSLAIQGALHPVSEIDPRNPTPAYQRLRERLEQALERRGLL
jgi:multiple sugar transport system substrate-binding protein